MRREFELGGRRYALRVNGWALGVKRWGIWGLEGGGRYNGAVTVTTE